MPRSSNSMLSLCGTDMVVCSHSTTPTAEQILVPETLLKKRKASEKTAEERKAAAVERKKVCQLPPLFLWAGASIFYDAQQPYVTSPQDDVVVINHLSGLTKFRRTSPLFHQLLSNFGARALLTSTMERPTRRSAPPSSSVLSST